MILVTGGAGFIGSNFVLDWLAHSDEPVLNVDALTYAGSLRNLAALGDDPRHLFVRADICDQQRMLALLREHRPRALLNFAAESHVDRSILAPAAFVATNINGTFSLLEAVRAWWSALGSADQAAFRFLHVSTDEVYGALGPGDAPFTETSAYAPNSPYSASKAASDHLVRAWHHTYGLPTLATSCSNNYGPFQFPEKLIPLVIANALAGRPLPVYGDGMQVRDWLYVGDHGAALRRVLAAGTPGQAYNIGGSNEMTNVAVVNTVCGLLDQLAPKEGSYRALIAHVRDRPGHDRRYAVDAGKMERELGWKPAETFASGIDKTVRWYVANQAWVADVLAGAGRESADQDGAPREQRR
jgi:dTDP-glucose 4,6-dehydratase